MKKMFIFLLKSLIYNIIEKIEKIEYTGNDFTDADTNPLKKIINILPLTKKNLSVKTDYGYVPVEEMNMTAPISLYRLELENGLTLECADDHVVFCENHIPKFVSELTEDDYVLHKYNFIYGSKVKSIKNMNKKISMFDLTVSSEEHSYFTNDILSHNTISASIVILHFITFNNDKGCMIVANKGATTKEIIDKIKSIYKYLPFFLKKGVINWNEKSITLENGCRIKTESRSKEPAIGFTIDLLYLDEFAHIPNNIVEPYYGAVVPTVSSIDNSKIIITSTPKGYNLFHKLYTGAILPEGDPDKNMYHGMNVYWYEVAGRLDPILKQHKLVCEKYGIVIGDILSVLKEKYGLEIKREKRDNNVIYRIIHDKSNKFSLVDGIRTIRINKIPLGELCVISDWKEDETKLIGSRKMFEQEYNIAFLSGDDLIFNAAQMSRLTDGVEEFEHIEIDSFDEDLTLPYKDLVWLKNKPEIFDMKNVRNYHYVSSVDLAEGLGQDYTVLNIFRVMLKDYDEIEKNKTSYKNMYDYFKLEQVGFFRNRYYSIKEFADFYYKVMFELLDPEKCKTVLEYNTYGGDFLNCLPHTFEGKNEYSNSIFLRYKHRIEDIVAKRGLKVTKGNKKPMIKDFQQNMYKHNIHIHHQTCIDEIKMFSKKESPSGEVTYKCETGHDDTVMTIVNLSSAFNNIGYKNLVENIINYGLTVEQKIILEKHIGSIDTSDTIDYKSFSKIKKNTDRIPYQVNPFIR